MRALALILLALALVVALSGCQGDRRLAKTLRDHDWACAAARTVFNGSAPDARIVATAVRHGATAVEARDLVARSRRVPRSELDHKLGTFCVPPQGIGGG